MQGNHAARPVERSREPDGKATEGVAAPIDTTTDTGLLWHGNDAPSAQHTACRPGPVRRTGTYTIGSIYSCTCGWPLWWHALHVFHGCRHISQPPASRRQPACLALQRRPEAPLSSRERREYACILSACTMRSRGFRPPVRHGGGAPVDVKAALSGGVSSARGC